MMSQRKPLSKETIARIRELVLYGTPKMQVAQDFNITYRTVYHHTKDIRTQKVIPQKIKEKIREDIKQGKSKYQAAKDYHLAANTVYALAKDLPSAPGGRFGIRGKTLDILQDLVSKGYYLCSHKDKRSHFLVLKKYFPSLRRTRMHHKTVFYLEGHENDAARAFIGNMGRNIMSYQELTLITNMFHARFSKTEKKAFFFKNKRPKVSKHRRIQKKDPLQLDLDSFSFFYIRKYCSKWKKSIIFYL